MIHNFSLLVEELGGKDDQLAEFVENSNAVFAALAAQDANLSATVAELPGTLRETRTALAETDVLADELGPRWRRCSRAPARWGRRCARRARSWSRRRRSSRTRSARSCAPPGPT